MRYVVKKWNDGAVILARVLTIFTSGYILIKVLKSYKTNELGKEFFIEMEGIEEFDNYREALDRYYMLIL